MTFRPSSPAAGNSGAAASPVSSPPRAGLAEPSPLDTCRLAVQRSWCHDRDMHHGVTTAEVEAQIARSLAMGDRQRAHVLSCYLRREGRAA